MPTYKIVASRIVQREINKEKLRAQLMKAAGDSVKGTRGSGWLYDSIKFPPHQRVKKGIEYTATIYYKTTSDKPNTLLKWEGIVKKFAEVASAGSLRNAPWKVIEPEGFGNIADGAKIQATKAEARKIQSNEEKVLGDINLVPDHYFENIYGRDAQISRIMGALHLAKRTDFRKRTHSLLDGPPGCGKTTIMEALSVMLGPEGDSWRWFDATSMTSAGAIEEIIENPIVPPVLFIEEIEKADDNALRWLLGIMDTRGMIRRTNYRVGNQAKNVRMCVIASANNVQLLKSIMSGALYSRFQNKIYCPPPDREIMRQILVREVKDIDGRPEWIEPTLQFGFDKWGIIDPRDLITICSCGGDDLLTGKYQIAYENTMHPEERRSLLHNKKKRTGKGLVDDE